MDWPMNFPPEVLAKIQELRQDGVPRDYYGAKFWGTTGYFDADNMLPEGWEPRFS